MSKRRIDIQVNAVAKASRSARRRGVVLILVVAVLGILFVAGAALLNSVTFSAKTLEAAKVDRENRAAVRAVEGVVAQVLRRGFLGPDGKPYNAKRDLAASSSLLTATGNTSQPWRVNLPMYGEIPGVNTWLSLTEPEEDGTLDPANPDCSLSMYTYLPWAMEDKAAIDPSSIAMGWNDPDGPLARIYLSLLAGNPSGNPVREPFQIMDADGDGIPDSFAMPITDDVMSPELRRALADRLRDPAAVKALQDTTFANNNPDFDPDTLWLSLRIVPHGAMVNVNSRLPDCQSPSSAAMWVDTLLPSILGENPNTFFGATTRTLSTAYLPESEEWALRYRGGAFVPRGRAKSRLVADFAQYLLEPHASVSGTLTDDQLLDPANRVWWPYDPATLGDYSTCAWRQAVDAVSGAGVYDLNHVLTTVSADDQLIRSGIALDGRDWIEAWKSDDVGYESGGGSGSFERDDYPSDITDQADPRLGRLKFSFPYFSKNELDYGGIPDGESPRLGGMTAATKLRMVRLLQDTFVLMLRNYVGLLSAAGTQIFATDDDVSIAAASLTANLLDFADMDGVPTQVAVRDWRTGAEIANQRVYGIERQPFITELYANLDVVIVPPGESRVTQNSTYAIELYNPYDEILDLTDYELVDLGSGVLPKKATDGTPLARLGATALTGTIAGGAGIAPGDPSRFKVFYTGYGQAPGVVSPQDLGEFGLDKNSVITLHRIVNVDTNGDTTLDEVKVPVDRFRASGQGVVDSAETPVVIPTFGEVGSGSQEVSLQRDTSVDTTKSPARSFWRFTVPRAQELIGPSSGTIGATNTPDMSSIRSVLVDCANAQNDLLRTAFPTTGTMLLLMRHAHVVKGPNRLSERWPFNDYQDHMRDEYQEIDNGRMPVFDTAGKYRAALSAVPGEHQGVEALPWGQLVFDYFTALPLDSEYRCDELPSLYSMMAPPVEQNGLRVSGRINLNAAPWSVVAGLPLMPLGDPATTTYGLYALPAEMREKIGATYPSTQVPGFEGHRYTGDQILSNAASRVTTPVELGEELAQAIVAYRDARKIPSNGMLPDDPNGDTVPDDTFASARGPSAAAPLHRRGYGFLTVGELLNVQLPFPAGFVGSGYGSYSFDRQAVLDTTGDYVTAVGLMVGLCDWVTTKSHVFTVYGTIRGQFYHDANDLNDSSGERADSLKAVDQRAIRFQTTVDRLPMLFGQDGLTRIGSLMIGPYNDMNDE